MEQIKHAKKVVANYTEQLEMSRSKLEDVFKALTREMENPTMSYVDEKLTQIRYDFKRIISCLSIIRDYSQRVEFYEMVKRDEEEKAKAYDNWLKENYEYHWNNWFKRSVDDMDDYEKHKEEFDKDFQEYLKVEYEEYLKR